MKILFIHPNFPAQFKYLAREFASNPKNEVVFACNKPNKLIIPKVKKVVTTPNKPPKNNNSHKYLKFFEKAIYSAQAMWRLCKKIKNLGFTPDVIYCHSGWGDGMFLKDLFPNTPFIAYMEFYYRAFGADAHFHPNSIKNSDRIVQIRIQNAANLINLEACDWAISPTQWQASLHPSDFYHKFSVIHEGVDTDILKPIAKKVNLHLPNGVKIPKDTRIVTYTTRNFEPYRGFDQACIAIKNIQDKYKDVHAILVGNDEVSYGAKHPSNRPYREIVCEKINFDPKRTHWLHKLPFEDYTKILQHSTVHIYLTVPFVLSWSLIESMSSGCAIVTSNNQPVQEVIDDGVEGVMANFFSPSDITNKIIKLLDDENFRKELGKNARQKIVKNYSIKKLLPVYMNLITQIAKGKINPSLKSKLNPNFNSI